MLDEQGFDNWSEGYDQTVLNGELGYPFEGYRRVLDTVFTLAQEARPHRVLDIGIGTGQLAQRFYKLGMEITGIDFSEGMLRQARAIMPLARLHHWDMNTGFPPELEAEQYDCIISTYAFHHFEDSNKLDLIQQLLKKLSGGGRLILGDIAFETGAMLELCRNNSTTDWDETEHYISMDAFGSSLRGMNIQYSYEQVSSCAGVLTIKALE